MDSVFSTAEVKVINLIGRDVMTIRELTDLYYEDSDEPMEANNTVAGIVRRVATKCDYHRLTWTIKGEGMGRAGKTVKRVKRG